MGLWISAIERTLPLARRTPCGGQGIPTASGSPRRNRARLAVLAGRAMGTKIPGSRTFSRAARDDRRTAPITGKADGVHLADDAQSRPQPSRDARTGLSVERPGNI